MFFSDRSVNSAKNKNMKRTISLIIIILTVFAAAQNSAACYKDLALSDDDVVLTAKAVREYADGKNFLVKAAVTAMIYNRIGDPALPSDVEGALSCPRPALVPSPGVVPYDMLEEYVVLAKLVRDYGIDPTCGAVFCFVEGDPAARGYDVTLILDGLVFAKPY